MPNSEQAACFYSQHHLPVPFNTSRRGRFWLCLCVGPGSSLVWLGLKKSCPVPGPGRSSPRCPSVSIAGAPDGERLGGHWRRDCDHGCGGGTELLPEMCCSQRCDVQDPALPPTLLKRFGCGAVW